MKTSKLLTASLFVFGIIISGNTIAQTYADGSNQIVRNTSPVTYTASNPDGTTATFTWTVTGGIIVIAGVDQGTSYTQTGTAAGTVSIQVRWNNANTTSANAGTLTVSKTVGTLDCPSATHTVNIQSWVAPNASSISTTTATVCSGAAPLISMTLQGNPNGLGFSYRWQIIRLSDNQVIEDQTSTSTSATVTVPVSVINNTSGVNASYRYRLVELQDAFAGTAVTSFTASSVDFTVNAVPVVGPIDSSTGLILR